MKIEEVRGQLRRRLRQRPAFIAISAKSGRGLDRLLDTVDELFDRYVAKVPTPELNNVARRAAQQAAAAVEERQAAEYAVRGADPQRPPRFRIFVNDQGLVTRDYAYWVENEVRERFGLEGVPVSIDFVRRT